MARHSKNNTALGFFTYDEKRKAQGGTKKQRLGKDSMRRFDHCYLCLQKARTPLTCTRGHVTCRECTVEHIVTQKAALAQQAMLVEIQNKAEQEALKAEEKSKSEEALANFEKLQSQVTSVNAITSSNIQKFSGEKRKADTEITSRKLGEGYAASKLPSFWIPELTPAITAPKVASASNKLTQCTAAEPHNISMKKMIPIKFETSAESKDDPICPACLKVLTNASKPTLLIPCSHVLCSSCTKRFVAPSKTCYTCSVACPLESDQLPLHHDGTGYSAGGGKIVTSRFGLAFQ
ncbi:hypothetical protein DSO57_1023737 [Entomophthora muscae]|uniref:Uncharacterized protein n=2 Tax=Entomophthora muscae TaxID=34485 RepID=A0ACC2RHJ8_9FUNG|nr:hypothetical protein DSO57_1023737 [Entomophthora muscae]